MVKKLYPSSKYTEQVYTHIIKYSLKHGIASTIEALSLDSSRSISKATLCRWRRVWKRSCEVNYGAGNLYDLKYESKKPKNYRQSKVNGKILEFIQLER